jgi:hypothetical protein
MLSREPSLPCGPPVLGEPVHDFRVLCGAPVELENPGRRGLARVGVARIVENDVGLARDPQYYDLPYNILSRNVVELRLPLGAASVGACHQ